MTQSQAHGIASLRYKIALPVVLLVALAALVPGLVSVYESSGTLTTRAQDSELLAAQLAAEHFDASLRGKMATVEGIVKLDSLKTMNKAQMDADIQQIRLYETDFTSLIVIDADGKIVSFVDKPHNEGASLALRQYFQIARNEGRSNFSDSVLTLDKTITVAAAAPIRNDRAQIVGVLAGTFDVHLKNLNQVILDTHIGQSGYAYLVDRKGILVTHPDTQRALNQEDFSKYSVVQKVMAGEAGIARYTFDGIEMLAAYVPVPASGWGIVVQQPLAEANAPVVYLRNAVGLIILVSALIAVLVGIYMAIRITHPLGLLKASAMAIGGGNLDTRVPDLGRDEIGLLARTLNEMRARLKQSVGAVEQANADLRESEAKLKALIDNTTDTIWSIDPEYRLTTTNASFREGLARFIGREIRNGESVFIGVSQAIADEWKPLYARALEGATFSQVSISHGGLRGSVHRETFFNPIREQDGKVVGVACFSRDITERKRADEALRENEQRLASIYNTVGDVIYHLAVEPQGQFRFVSVNPAFFRVTGLGPETVVGKTVNEVIPEPSLTMVLGKYQQAIKDNAIVRWEETSDYPTGRLTGEVSIAPVFNDQGVCTHLVGAVHDITERERVEQARRESEAIYHDLVETSQDLIWQCNAEGRYTYLNPAWEQVFGYKIEEMLGKRFADFQTPEYAERDLKEFARLLKGNTVKGLETVHLGKAGRAIHLVFNAKLLVDEQGNAAGTSGTAYDITERKRAEEALRESEEKFRALAEYSLQGITLVQDERAVYANATQCQITGYSEEETLAQTPAERFEVIHPDDRAGLQERRARLQRGAQIEGLNEFRIIRKNGDVGWVMASARTFALGGNPSRLTMIVDITERKRAEEALRDSEEKYRHLFNNAEVGMFRTRLDGSQILEFNERYLQILGYTFDEVKGKPSVDMWADKRERAKMVQRLQADGRVIDLECDLLTKQGEVINCVTSLRLYRDAGILEGSIMDITARKRVEERLRHMQDLLNQTQALSKIGGWEYDVRARRIIWTDEVYRIHGLDPAIYDPNHVSQNISFYAPADQTKITDAFQQAVETGKPYDLELGFINARGEDLWVRTIGQAEQQEGEIVRVSGNIMDITARKRAEEVLRQSEERYRLATDAGQAAVWRMNLATGQMETDGALERIVGYKFGEIGTQVTWNDVTHPDDLVWMNEIWQAIIEGRSERYDIVHRMLHKDGSIRWVDVHGMSVRGESGRVTAITGTTRDITERKRAEESLRQAKEYAENLIRTANVMIVGLDVSGNVTVFNDTAEKISGYTRADLEGKNWFEVLVPKDRYPYVWEEFARLTKRGGVPRTFENPILTKSGEERLIAWQNSELRENGNIVGTISFGVDITERKRAEDEIRKLNAELEQRVAARTAELQAKNRELETFTYSVSHDLKAPLRGIDGYSRLLVSNYADRLDDDGKFFVNTIRTATEKMNQLIDDLLAYSRLERRAFAVGSLSVLPLIQALVAERAEEIHARGITLAVEVPDATVTGEYEGLAQAIRNLLDNALKFTRTVPQARIEIGGRATEKSCILWMRDNGPGFDMKYHDRIFEIFQRLQRDEDYPGTGIGLAIVRKAMERIGGRAWAESVPGEGACFYLEVPK